MRASVAGDQPAPALLHEVERPALPRVVDVHAVDAHLRAEERGGASVGVHRPRHGVADLRVVALPRLDRRLAALERHASSHELHRIDIADRALTTVCDDERLRPREVATRAQLEVSPSDDVGRIRGSRRWGGRLRGGSSVHHGGRRRRRRLAAPLAREHRRHHENEKAARVSHGGVINPRGRLCLPQS